MKYMNTTLRTAIHHENDNPVFGESATHVTIEDEAGGGFIKLQQFPDEGVQTLWFDLDELVEVLKVAKRMLKQYDKNGGNK